MTKTYIANSKIDCQGTFAKAAIKKGEFITSLTGETIDNHEMFRRVQDGIEYIDDPLQIGDALYLDLDETSRVINHSCNPNAGIRYANKLFAIKNIAKNEEITFDYLTTVGIDVDNKNWKMKCNCGKTKCRKTITNVLSIPSSQFTKYNKAGVIPDFILNQLADISGSISSKPT